MSYTPTTWATGDVITADKLNNMESGIAGAGAEVTFVKIIDTLTISDFGIKFDEGLMLGLIAMGGSLAEGKSLGELVNGKTIVGYTSSFQYNGNAYRPCATGINNFSLDKQAEYMDLKVVGFSAIITGIVASKDTSSTGTLNIYAICI